MSTEQDKPEAQTPGGSVRRSYASPEGKLKLGFSDAPPEWRELRESYYDRHFGSEAKVWHEMLPVVPHIDVYAYPPSREHGRDFTTLITAGMSDERMTLEAGLPAQLARAELVMYVPAFEPATGTLETPWTVQLLRFLAHFPFDYQTWLGYGHTIPNGDPAQPFTTGSQLTTAYLIAPFFEERDFDGGLKLNGDRVNFLWVTLLTNDETAYKLEHGSEALLDRFQEADFPRVLDPGRASILTSR